MEIQLQELIDQIKNDGVKAAEAEAASILESAKAEAEKIISDAKAEAEKTMLEAKAQNERFVRAGEDSIRQAGRNLLISFRESVAKELNVIVGDKVKEALSSEALSQLIFTAVENWTKDTEAEDLSVLVGREELASLEAGLLAGLKDRMREGVTLKVSDDFEGGFRISVQDGQAYYDYSAEAVTELLSVYLTPKLISLMKEAENV
ncbi:MAG TPA: V-type ATP synthase subunit E [Candidatus Fimimorpha excrementavium]|nr:V-type ATP synthase subunit E [Candidatus Fimimorpha excrementavium]